MGYLDPRPTRDSIGLAYSDYYTHAAPAETGAVPKTGLGWLRLALRNGYLNARYNYSFQPSLRLGYLLAYLVPPVKAREDLWIRHLRRPAGKPRLLDAGCGNGAFLSQMQAAGWEVQGIDPDANAVAAVRSRNLPVLQGSLEDVDLPDRSFDAVTLSHVIEHLHNPVRAIETCFRILRPGGVLWIVTPNLDGYGYQLFGEDWLGLDVPRHLVLFTRASLGALVKNAGFEILSAPVHTSTTEWYFRSSAAIAQGRDPLSDPPPLPANLVGKLRLAKARVWLRPAMAEELVLLARKPAHNQ